MVAGVPVAAFLVLTIVPAAAVEDSMTLDLRFRESLSKGEPFSANNEGQPASRQSSEVRAPQGHVVQKKRSSPEERR
jgi:hypothetical protein